MISILSCLSASLPSLTFLDTQLPLLAGTILRRSFPRSHLLPHLLLPKFSCSCWTWLCVLLCSPKSHSTPLRHLHPLCRVDNFILFLLVDLVVGFGCFFFFFHTMGQGVWALPSFQINTNNEYCCSPSQGHKEFVSSAILFIPHSSSRTSRCYLCGTLFRYSANI